MMPAEMSWTARRARALMYMAWALLGGSACKSEEPPAPPPPKPAPGPAAASRQLPSDVTAFVSRQEECHHWGGEEPYSKERAREIRAAAERLACERLEADARALRSKYQDNREVLESLDAESSRLSDPQQ
ncbi:hypothetical protein D7X55_08410 [Corallococcus sp. AB049A]|nr:hypothetical protein D7X55_08410 [Corallococcus sp. AB049A]